MDSLRIVGGHALRGEVPIAGAKNAALPIMTAALLSEETLALSNVPRVADIHTLAQLLEGLGVRVETGPDDRIQLNAKHIRSVHADYELVRKMRASVLVLGPLLARRGEAEVSLPGGCAIGRRPVNRHVEALAALGAEVRLEEGYLHARLPKGRSRLAGGRVLFSSPSVGATENALMAACLARGETKIVNAAREPEVADLARCLVAMGAEIDGIGSSTLFVQGKERLHAARHDVLPDRVEAGTYAIAAAITGGKLRLTHMRPQDLEVFFGMLAAANVRILAPPPEQENARAEDETARTQAAPDGVEVDGSANALRATDITTAAHPGFATDLQAQFMALMTQARGESHITESIFENRFMHAQELVRLGAKIDVHGATATVEGPVALVGAPVMATDLRASVGLVLAALAARGETEVRRVYHLDRGYQDLERKLRAVGAEISRRAPDP